MKIIHQWVTHLLVLCLGATDVCPSNPFAPLTTAQQADRLSLFASQALALGVPSGRQSLDPEATFKRDHMGPPELQPAAALLITSQGLKLEGIILRPAMTNDLQSVIILRRTAFPASVGIPAFEEGFDDWYLSTLKSDSNAFIVVAEQDGHIVGLMACRRSEHETVEVGEAAVLPNPSIRRKGIARTLNHVVLVEAKRRWPETKTAEAFLKSNNSIAANALSKMGFIEDLSYKGDAIYGRRFIQSIETLLEYPPAAAPPANRDRFEDYLKQNGMDQYPHLRDRFSKAVQEALLRDPALRPVFLQVLPDSALGPLEAVDGEAVKNLQALDDGRSSIELLESHSGFLVGSPAAAEMLCGRGEQIIVGVTDRWSKDSFRAAQGVYVANGRQCYFPLKDGSWLGVKGSGQYNQDDLPPHYVGPGLSEHQGITSAEGAYRAQEARARLQGAGGSFVEFLGFRRLKALPDGGGQLVSINGVQNGLGEPVHPVLSFHRALTPHRMVKFPQLLMTDPGLARLAADISGVLGQKRSWTGRELLLRSMELLGRSEAAKTNSQLFKETVHSQDFAFLQESDLGAAYERETYLARVAEGHGMADEIEELVQTLGLSIIGLRQKVGTLMQMVREAERQKQLNVLFPYPLEHLRVFFTGYFALLDRDDPRVSRLRVWAESGVSSLLPNPLYAAFGNLQMEIFHPANTTLEHNLKYRSIVNEMIRSWAMEELARRAA